MTKPKKIAIIGGGAAGMMAAAALIEETVSEALLGTSPEIFLFEKNLALGRKVIISGGGRCNVTTGLRDKNLLRKKYIRGAEFLTHALSFFPPARVYDWFESHGVPLKIEEDGRVFPRSNKGTDVVAVFERMFSGKVNLKFGEAVKVVKPSGDGFVLETSQANYEFDVVVITSGGNAYRHTGSSGDGYDFARECGHSITPLGPSLNSFEVLESWPTKLSGISLPNVRLQVTVSGVRKTFEGPFLFTHFGVTGPAVFGISAHLAFMPISPTQKAELILYPEAQRGLKEWDNLLRVQFEEQGAAQIHNIMAQLLPRRLSEEILVLAGLARDRRVSKISREERLNLSGLLGGGLKLHLTNRRPGDEFVTAGGVATNEVHNKTMQSLKNPGLYLAGEVLDVDGVTGGFNLQASWATGRLAGISVAKRLRSQ